MTDQFWHGDSLLNPTVFPPLSVWTQCRMGSSSFRQRAGKPTDSCMSINTFFPFSPHFSLSLPLTVIFLVCVVWFSARRDGNWAGIRKLAPMMWLHTILAGWVITAYATMKLYTTTCLKNARTHAESFSSLPLIKMHEVRGCITLFASLPVRQIRHNRSTIMATGQLLLLKMRQIHILI